MAAVPCDICAQSMLVPERTILHDSKTAGNFHSDCSRKQTTVNRCQPEEKGDAQKMLTWVIRKRAGLPVELP